MNHSIIHYSPDDIYAIPANEKWILFSPNNSTSAMVNRAAVKAVAGYAARETGSSSETIKNLWRNLSTPASPEHAPEPDREKLVIIPTRSCNMKCVYCDFVNRDTSSAFLNPRLACKLIDYMVKKRTSVNPSMLRIHFFGGEPLVAHSCVETAIHYARMACARGRLIPWFEITTNGFFDPSGVPFIGDHVDSVVISLDGDCATHDFNRRRVDGGGTYDTIAKNIHLLGEFPAELSLRSCITSRSVDMMPAMTSHFCSEFKFDLLCFEMLTPNPSAYEAGITPPDPCQFAAGVLKSESIAASRGVRIIHGPSELIGPRLTSCPVGRDTLMLTPEGILTACYLEVERWTSRGLEPVIGRVDPDSGPIIDQSRLQAVASLLHSKSRCERCFCRKTCAGGCHIDQTPPGCALEYDDRCRATRIITAGRLVRQLDGTAAAESFAGCASAIKAVAENPDDRLTAWFPDRIKGRL